MRNAPPDYTGGVNRIERVAKGDSEDLTSLLSMKMPSET
jgi:hypothetical protein